MDSVKAELHTFIDDPMDPTNNYNMGVKYFFAEQYAAAFSHFMRASERSDDTRFAARSLLYASKSMGLQEGRDIKELDLIGHALSIGYKYPEVHCIKAMYHSWRKDWTQCYAACCMALELIDTYEVDEPFLGYSGKEIILNQKAMAEYNRARYNDSRATYNSILEMDISDCLRRQIQNKLKEFPEPYSEPITWDYNHSQIFQDVFVETVMNKKENGTYLEIGAGNYKFGNNTLMLEEKYGWKGVSLEWNKDLVYKFNTNRKNQCICADATKVDYAEILKDLPNTIDYLQLDCDPPSVTFEILKLIPFDTHQFNVITYEHDYYNDPTKSFRQKSRDYLTSKGYILAVGDVTADREEQMNFEDWWVHPRVASNCPRIHTSGPICGERYFEPIKVIEDPIFEISNQLTTINNYHKNTPATFKLFKTCFICDCIRRGYRWEEHQHDIIDKYLDEKSIAIEAGSHIGTLAVKLAKTCNFTYCFEPVINTYDLLEFNMNKNCMPNKFKLFNKGLGESIKNENISWISPESAGALGLTNNTYNPASQDEYLSGIETIEIITIDSLCLDKLDYIKIDVEGYEEHVINGGIETIKQYKPIIVLECYETFSPSKPASLEFVKDKYKFLIDIGYTIKKVWNADFILEPEVPLIQPPKHLPTSITIDNFYDDPDEVREYALGLEYQPEENHGAVGFRSEAGRRILPGTRELFEKYLGRKIKNWDVHRTNGCFQWCPETTRIVYHCDQTTYAAIIFLTPDAPPEAGLSLCRHKKYKIMDNSIFGKPDWYSPNRGYKEPHTDKTPWERVDKIGNVYNRLVFFNAHNVHAVSEYFGDQIHNSRLFQLFFFDV